MAESTEPTQVPQVTALDLKSGDPSRLNRILRLFASKITAIQGLSEKPNIPSTLTVKQVKITDQNPKTVMDTDAITFATAKNFFSPEALRQSLISHSFDSQPVSSLPGGTGSQLTILTTHATRLSSYLPANSPQGILLYEADRTVFYINSMVGNLATWVYVSGTMRDTFANIPLDLGAGDAGFQFEATDQTVEYRWVWSSVPATGRFAYLSGKLTGNLSDLPPSPGLKPEDFGFQYYAKDVGHEFRFDGLVWEFASLAPGYIVLSDHALPSAMWGVCNGSVYQITLSTGQQTAYTTLDLVNQGSLATQPYLRLGGSSGSAQDAIPPTIAAASTGTGVNLATVSIPQGTGAAILAAASAHAHPPGTITVTVDKKTEPSHVQLIPYVRL